MAGLNPGNLIFLLIHFFGLASFASVFNWLIIAGFGVLAVWLGSRERRLGLDLRRLKAVLVEEPPNERYDMALERHFEGSDSVLKPFWNEYRVAVKHGERERITPDILRFFSRQEILYTAGVRRSVDAVPALLTMGGILGTFLALVAGLHGLNVANSGGLSSGITQLIAGLSLKFTASVIGISLALVWIIADKLVWRPRLLRAVSDVQGHLAERFPAPPEELVLQQLQQLQARQADDLDALVNDTLLPKLVEGFGQVLDEHLLPELQGLTTQLTQMSQTMQQATENAAEKQRDTIAAVAGQLVDNLSAQSKEFFHDLTDALHSTIATQNTLLESLTGFTGTVSSSLDGLRESVAQQTIMVHETHALVAELQQTAQVWETIPDRLASHTEAMSSVIQGIREHLEETVRQLAEHQTQAYQHLLTYAEHLDELSDQLQADIGDATETLAREQREAADRLALLLGQAEEANRSSMDGVAKVHETAQFLREYWETQTTQVSVLQASMADVVVAVQSVGGDVERSVTALRQEVTRTVESLEQNLASGLRRSFEEFDQELSQALHHLSSGVAALSDVVQEVRVPADHMRQLAKTTGALVQDFEKVAVSLSRASSTPSELDSDSLQMSTGEQT